MHHQIHIGTKYLLAFTLGAVATASIILVTVAMIVGKPKSTASVASAPATATYDLRSESKTINQDDPTKRLMIRATYPVVSGLSTTVNDKINAAITDLVTTELTGQAKTLRDADWPERGDMELSFLLNAQFIDQQAAPNLRTLYVREEGYSGGAHGWHTVKTLTFNLATGEVIPLSALFTNHEQYLQQLSPLVKTATTNQLTDDTGPMSDADWISRGTAPKAENYGAFVITDDGLGLVMQEYQVGPYAIGLQVITLPYAEIANLIDPSTISLIKKNL